MTDLFAFHRRALRLVGAEDRYVATPEGEAWFKKPIGAPITRGAPPKQHERDLPGREPTPLPAPPPVIRNPPLPRPPAGVKAEDHEPTVAAMKARGDVYGHFVPPRPGTHYGQGDPRNDLEYEGRDKYKSALQDRYVTPPSREAIEKAEKEGLPEETVKQLWKAYRQAKIDRDMDIGGSTEELFDHVPDTKTGADPYIPVRRRLHQKILRDLEAKAVALGVPKQGKCLIMAGPSGAGKSTFIAKFAQNAQNDEDEQVPEADRLDVVLVPDPDDPKKMIPGNYIVINPDDFKDDLPTDLKRYPGLKANEMASVVHEESSYLAKAAVRRMMAAGYNVILDVTLANAKKAVKEYVTPYADKYTYTPYLVDGTIENSLNNAGIRYKKPDKYTGERTYGGRFVTTKLVEGQRSRHVNPEKELVPPHGPEKYRTLNAGQFDAFRHAVKCVRPRVFDPSTRQLVDAEEWMPTPQSEHAKAAVLAGRLRAQGGGSTVGHQTTEITEKIKAYRAGSLSEDALIQYLTTHRYADKVDSGLPWGHDGRYYDRETGPEYTPGGWDEVELAYDTKLLPEDVFNKVADLISERSHPNA